MKNTGQGSGRVGFDINVTNVWNTYRGSNVRIGIVDDGIDLQHPDLVSNLDQLNGYDWNDFPHDTDPSARPNTDLNLEDSHGTSVAGVAAASSGNGMGVSGWHRRRPSSAYGLSQSCLPTLMVSPTKMRLR